MNPYFSISVKITVTGFSTFKNDYEWIDNKLREWKLPFTKDLETYSFEGDRTLIMDHLDLLHRELEEHCDYISFDIHTLWTFDKRFKKS